MRRCLLVLSIVIVLVAVAAAVSDGGVSRRRVALPAATFAPQHLTSPDVPESPTSSSTTTTEPPTTTLPAPTTVAPQERVLNAPIISASDTQSGPASAGHPSDEHWFAIGRCEQPGNGYQGVQWDTHSNTYEGGLGFALATWREYRHADMPESAGDASWEQQLVVANDLWDRYGPRPWGCKSDVG